MGVDTKAFQMMLEGYSMQAPKSSQVARQFWKTNLSDLTTASLHGLAIGTANTGIRIHTSSPVNSQDQTTAQKFAQTLNGSNKGFALAAWAFTLNAHTGNDFGTTCFAVSDLSLGPKNATYLLKLSYSPDASLQSWIYDVAAVNKSFLDHASIGYEKLSAYAPNFVPQTMIAFTDGLDVAAATTQPPVVICVNPSTWEISANHDAGIPQRKVRVLLDHMNHVMSRMATEPTRTVSNLDLVSSAERALLLRLGEATSPAVQGLLHQLVERQAEIHPDAPAVQFENNPAISYRELNEQANVVARQLVCGRGSYVPVYMSRSINMVITLIAILKTGAAYVLLSEDTPLERNLFIINDLRAPFTVVNHITRGRIPKEVVIEDLVSTGSAFDRHNLNVYQATSDVAYVIYTSGTTGTPKGVLLGHEAACTGLCALPAQSNLRQLLCHNPVFSAAQRSIFGTLSRGGTLCLASKENLTVNIQSTISQMDINSLEITPSMASLIDPSSVSSNLRRITFGGESISPAIVQKWSGRVELVNAYGLSENTQMSWRQTLTPTTNIRMIGRPTDSTLSYVLVPGSTRLSPLLVPGELCLGGHQLAREYLNQPEKTKEVFIENPFGPGRLYRTGDCAICHEDGSIELIGRIDQQTKIDGQRVEPGESNALIQQNPMVVESCTVAASVLGRKALVAAIVPKEGVDWPTLWSDAKASLRSRLPLYAVPSYWVRLEQIPHNVNGKVDIASLIKIVEGLDGRDLLSLPRMRKTSIITNEVEDAILNVLARRFTIPPSSINLDVSFQDLGGSSLDAIHITSQLREVGISTNVGLVLQAESLREIAASSRAVEKEPTTIAPFSLAPSTFKRGDVEDAYPATPLQEGLIAESLLGKSNNVYRRVYSINGVSTSQLRSAFLSVIKKSPLLRTTFVSHKKGFLQTVNKSVSLPWKELDTDLESFLRTTTSDLSVLGSLVRSTVLKGKTLVVDVHHVLFDFWSNHFLFEDINSVLLGRDPVVRTPFSVYVQFQKSQDNEHTRAFWKEYLQGAESSKVNLENKSRVGKVPDNNGFEVSSKLEADLAGNSLTHGTTFGALVHAAWALTLSIYNKTDDVHFATAFSGRDADIDGILTLEGPTLCVVPMRIKTDRLLNVLDFVRKVQTNHLWRLSEYAHYGMRNTLQAGGLAADTFNTMVNVLVKSQDVSAPEKPLMPISQDAPNFTQYVTLEINENTPGLAKLLVPFSADILTAQNLIDTFAHILEKVVEAPTTLVGELFLEFQPAFDERLPVIELQGQARASIHPELAHSAFEKVAATNPSKTALRTKDGKTLSYGELNAKANSFASWLQNKGVRPGQMVPLYMEKSLWTLIAIFGILKAGVSFTPLDPGNPHDRNSFIIKDVEATLVVTNPHNLEACKAFGIETVIIQALDLSSNTSKAPQVIEMTPESVIYAIYTSGSTGLPKGVLVQHSAVVAATEGMIEATCTDSSWVSLWVLNYVFDASYYDVFTVLSAGGTLCLAPQDELLEDLTGAINSMNVTQVMLTPTITKLIAGGSKSVPKLRVLNVCGEKIDTNILEWANHVDVYNGYGPTEATILMTVSKVLPGSSLNSIGFPMKHVRATVYHPDRVEQLPLGAVGELCVSGPQLAKGYLKRPEQTAAAFIRDENGELLYRTGDLAILHEDGHIECLGRKDYQVKINGHRIELGEIENAILGTGIVDGCVVAVAEMQNKRQLVAFSIFEGEHRSAKEAVLLPASGVERVPEVLNKLTTLSPYMVPSIWLPFSSFPKLPSGKTNRKELVALAERMIKADLSSYLQREASDVEFRAAETETEKIMLEAWATVLDEPEESIGATSNFASLGGDSISAINVVAACRNLGWSITVNNILSQPTLAEQAKHLKASQKAEPLQDMVYSVPDTIYDALRRSNISIDEEVEDIFPCGPGQVEFLTQGHNTSKQYWQLTVSRALSEGFDLDLWLDVTKKLTDMNQILRTTYLQSDPTDPLSWMQIVLKKPSLDWAEVKYSSEEEKQALIEALRDSHFDFGVPAVKYRLFVSRQDGSRTLSIKLHHASYDGTLLRIFDDQFTALARGDHDLEPPTEFKTFIDWNERSGRKEALAYWTQLLQDYKPTTTLPTHGTQNGGLKFAPISADVNSLALVSGVTASTIFQAAYAVLISQLSGTTDVLFDNLLTGRNALVDNPQLLNGACANFLPFRSRFTPATPVRSLLQDTQAHFWDTTEHGAVSLGDIYKALGQDRRAFSAKMLYCFQPFEPATGPQGQMHWIVMAMSKVMMNINYVVMLEVQKTLTGFRVKMQYDADVLSAGQAYALLGLYDQVLQSMVAGHEGTISDLSGETSSLHGVWA